MSKPLEENGRKDGSLAPRRGSAPARAMPVDDAAEATIDSDGEARRVAGELSVAIAGWLEALSASRRKENDALMFEVNSRLLAIEELVAKDGKQFQSMASSVSAAAGLMSQLQAGAEDLRQRIDACQLAVQAVARRLDTVVGDLIESRVSRPPLRQLTKVFARVVDLALRDGSALSSTLKSLAEEIESFLDASGYRMIYPRPGEAFDPRLHQPISQRPAGSPSQHKRISQTFEPGLAEGEKTLYCATVEVFVYSGEEPLTTSRVQGEDQ